MLHHVDLVGRTVLRDVEHRTVKTLVNVDAIVVAGRGPSNRSGSRALPRRQLVADSVLGKAEVAEPRPLHHLRTVSAADLRQVDLARVVPAAYLGNRGDRKSTRLNSSQ